MEHFDIPAKQRMLQWEGKVCYGGVISLLGIIISIAAWIWMDIYAVQEIIHKGITNFLLECAVFSAANFLLLLFTRFLFVGFINFWGKFHIQKEGIAVTYPFCGTRLYSWESIASIDICNTYVERKFLPIIRCFLNDSTNAVRKSNNRMLESYFGEREHVVIFAFTEERLKLFKQYYPAIADFRQTGKAGG